MTLKIWTFESTGDAYDACQSNEEIHRGAILLIASERVIGLADTWPVAITGRPGELHQAQEGQCGSYLLENNLDQHLADAIRLATDLRFQLLDEFATNADGETQSATRQNLRDTIVLAESLLHIADPENATGAIFDEVADQLALSGIPETLADTISDVEDEARTRGFLR